MHVAEPNRSQFRRLGAARHEPYLPLTGEQPGAVRRSGADAPQPDQLTGDAAAAAVQHADDHFLPDVAPLGERDGALLDARFERNGVVGHVETEDRIAALDPRRVIGRAQAGLVRQAEIVRGQRRGPHGDRHGQFGKAWQRRHFDRQCARRR